MSGGGASPRLNSLILNRVPDRNTLLLGQPVKCEDGLVPEDDTLNGELIAFDQLESELARDTFALFSTGSNGPSSSSSSEDTSSFRAGSIINFAPFSTFLAQQGASLGNESGMAEVDERIFPGCDHGALPEFSCTSSSNCFVDWGMLGGEPSFFSHHNHLVEQYNFQCGPCQILHCIIHSNGLIHNHTHTS